MHTRSFSTLILLVQIKNKNNCLENIRIQSTLYIYLSLHLPQSLRLWSWERIPAATQWRSPFKDHTWPYFTSPEQLEALGCLWRGPESGAQSPGRSSRLPMTPTSGDLTPVWVPVTQQPHFHRYSQSNIDTDNDRVWSHTFNPSTVEVDRAIWVQGQPDLQSEFQNSQNYVIH